MFRTLLLVATVGLTLSVRPCLAQDGSLLQVQPGAVLRLHFGDTLWVAGRVAGTIGESVPLRSTGAGRPTIEYRVSSLDSIQARSGTHTLAGTGIGLAVGYALGRVLVAQACSGRGSASATCRADPESRALGNTVTALGGAIGLVAGRAIPKWTRIRQ